MSIIGDFGVLKWNSANRKRYINLGYEFTGWGERFYVLIEHLTPTTRAEILAKCDYCGYVMDTDYKKYCLNMKRSIVKKCSCERCSPLKVKESSQIKYGVDSPNKANMVKDKKKECSLEKYGVENISQLHSTKEKVKNTVLNKYGVTNVFKSDEVISKIKITRYDNKTITTSKQQLYINNLVKGELNYPVGKCSIDIAILDKNLAIEYDGGGHDLHVRFNELTEEEFNKKEKRREFFLMDNGWKIIRIKSKKDYIPDNNSLLKSIEMATDYLNLGHKLVNIDIDECLLYGSNVSKPLKFKNLTKIK